ncbi:MAG TPA: glycoside hydrolase family 3 N-terminal domain-containing protein, partial [Roseiflexaceae bacterium]|nr:glycoside hydrolase family 3 N-terminal domain-containing protein [Roseiflexaceae bacterium]
KNGMLDPYEDPRRPIEERVENLLSQMTLEEKAGLMFHTIAGVNPDGTLEPPREGPFRQPIADSVSKQFLNHFNVHALPSPRVAAEWHNRLQELAESTRLGIPVTISSDPRHAFTHNPLTSFSSATFSQWPEPLGFGAIGDPDLVEKFGDIARQEYLAQGIRVALHPMADLATEPRWARNNGTFGEDAHLSAALTAAYIRGFQGRELGPHSVACMTKHFPGGGPQKDGEDPHFSYGKEQVYPGDNFDYHLLPFEAAFEAGTAQIMPYYGVPIGIGLEEVAFGFNKEVVTGMLRERYGFDGVVCTDWGLLTDTHLGNVIWEARAWGVEHLSRPERARKAVDAGVDQFGGESCPEVIVELVRSGQLSEARIDESARRLLREKFRLGLFDNPYLDVDAAERMVGRDDFRAAGADAQRRAIVLLKNGTEAQPVLPLSGKPNVYLDGVAASAANDYANVVDDLVDADLAILRIAAPYQPREGNFLERMFHAGDLDFKGEQLQHILSLLERIPTIVVVSLDRPAVIPEIAERSAALLADFGASDEAVLDVIFGRFAPVGKLPFELPSSMEAVRAQYPDLPHDSAEPLFAFGHGLAYG